MPNSFKLASVPAVLAAFSLAAAPASAAEIALPSQAPAYADLVPILDIEEAQTAEHHRYNRHRYRYRRGPGLGDVLAGVLIVGAIAHVASEASRNDRRYRERDYRDRDYRRDARWNDSRGIDRAVNICIDAVDRERRVETVDRVDRTARGWRVQGTITRGDPFTCRLDEYGRGVSVDFGSRGERYEDDDRDYDDDRFEDIDYDENDDRFEAPRGAEDNQHDDDRYASEWSKVDQGAAEDQVAYPGGPAEDSGEIDSDLAIGTGYKGAGN